MNENNLKSDSHPGMKKLGIGMVADNSPEGVDEAKWRVMKSILMTAITAGAIKLNVEESDGKTIVSGYMYVESGLPDVPTYGNRRVISHKALKEAKEKYPFLKEITSSLYNQ